MVLVYRHDAVAIVRVFTTPTGKPNKHGLSRHLEAFYEHAPILTQQDQEPVPYS
jgi:hypothetical protein